MTSIFHFDTLTDHRLYNFGLHLVPVQSVYHTYNTMQIGLMAANFDRSLHLDQKCQRAIPGPEPRICSVVLPAFLPDACPALGHRHSLVLPGTCQGWSCFSAPPGDACGGTQGGTGHTLSPACVLSVCTRVRYNIHMGLLKDSFRERTCNISDT